MVTIAGAIALFFAVWLGVKARAARREAETKTSQLEQAYDVLKQQNDDLVRKDRQIEQSSTLSQAYTLLSAGKLDEAEERFQLLLKTYQEQRDLQATARTHSSLGDIALKRGDYMASRTQYDKAVQVLGKDERFANQLGQTLTKTAVLYIEWGKKLEGQEDLQGAAKKYENSVGFYNKAKNAYKKAGNQVGVNEAKSGYDEAKKRYDDVQELLNPPLN